MALGVAVTTGCGLIDTDPESATITGSTEATAPTTTPSTPALSPDAATGGSSSTAPPTDFTGCESLGVSPVGTVAATDLVEVSGLGASRTHDDVLWAHNDSGSATVLHALSLDGTARGAVPVPVDGIDIEDMAVVGSDLYLADIGDNDRNRPEIAVFRVPEPEPGDTETGTPTTIRLLYPDGPHDAEAFLVDPRSGQLVIITKEIGFGRADRPLGPAPGGIYAIDVDDLDRQPAVLTRVGEVALDDLAGATSAPPPDGVVAQLGLGGLATGADVTADGSVVTIRTYQTAWLFPRRDGQTIAEALAATPCEAPTAPEEQGEAIAFVDQGPDAGPVAFVTISEGANPAINLTGS